MSASSLTILSRVTAATKARRAAALPLDERRQMIVAATVPLLLVHGERVTSRQIAEAAGIAEGTIFRAFVDKDELIAAVVESALDPEPLEAALLAIDGSLPFDDALSAAIEVLQQRVVDLWRLVSSIPTRFHERTKRPMTDSHALVQLMERYRNDLSVKPIVAARLLRALTLSVTHPMLAGEPMSATELRSLFLHGVGQC